jgi:hypothetical protein
MTPNTLRSSFLLAALLVACSSRAPETARSASPLVVICGTTPPPAGAFVCGETRTIECEGPTGTSGGTLHVTPVATSDGGTPPACSEVTMTANDFGPYPLGTHSIVVTQTGEAGTAEACRATLTVADTKPPAVVAKEVVLWPPNHKMHAVSISDCVGVTDACDAKPFARFTYVTSDEAPDGKGDGHTSPDVTIDECDAIQVRGERLGGGNGRVYRVGFVAEDHTGNTTTGECRVVVPHDQSGRPAVDDGAAYKVDVGACRPR